MIAPSEGLSSFEVFRVPTNSMKSAVKSSKASSYDPAVKYEVQCKREIPSDYIVFLNEDMSEIE